jgi:hypothetical protein
MLNFSTFQGVVSILYIWPITSTNEIALSYTKRKSILCSLDLYIFRVVIYMELWEKIVEEGNPSLNQLMFFSSISTSSIEKVASPHKSDCTRRKPIKNCIFWYINIKEKPWLAYSTLSNKSENCAFFLMFFNVFWNFHIFVDNLVKVFELQKRNEHHIRNQRQKLH